MSGYEVTELELVEVIRCGNVVILQELLQLGLTPVSVRRRLLCSAVESNGPQVEREKERASATRWGWAQREETKTDGKQLQRVQPRVRAQ